MPSLIDIRRRIRSVKNTQQITKAMKMVSAAKLRRAQDRVIAARPYGSMLRTMLGNVASAVAGDENAGKNPLLAQRPEQRILLVLVTSDKASPGRSTPTSSRPHSALAPSIKTRRCRWCSSGARAAISSASAAPRW